MKLHDLRPAPGSHTKKRRVGRGIAAGQGKTAGRGTKGQKARAGGSIPAWFEGGQTPLHMRIPKLRGFRNPFKIDYEVVNLGSIARLVELGVLEAGDMPGTKPTKAAKAAAPITVNQEILRAAGLVRTLNKPLKVLGHGEISTALFVVADAVSGSARTKIEAAGGTVSLLEVPASRKPALGLDDAVAAAPSEAPTGAPSAAAVSEPPAELEPAEPATEPEPSAESEAAAEPVTAKPAKSARPSRAAKAAAAEASVTTPAPDPTADAQPEAAEETPADPADA
jgi:large subunit ribosomal protein L15